MERNHIRRLVKFKAAHRTMKASRKLVLPGFEGFSIYVVSRFFIQGLQNGALNMRASSLAFNFFLALFPAIIFIFTLIPYIPIHDFQERLFHLLQTLLPKSAWEMAESTITDIIRNRKSSLLSVGFFSALLFSTNGFNAMINAFNETFHVIEGRSFLMQRLVSLLMVVVTMILVLVAITLIILSELAFRALPNESTAEYYAVLIGQWIILLALCFSFISFSYYVGPKHHKGWRLFSAGSIFATLLTILTSILFAYYVNNFGNYNKLYGSIGALIVIMLWMYINSLILLLGFDLNASISKAKREHSLTISADLKKNL